MEGDEAVNVFLELIKVKPDLTKMEPKDLGSVRFIGPAATAWIGRYAKRCEQKGLGDQRDAAMRDGEDIAKMIIEVEQEIGRRYQALPKEEVNRSGVRTRAVQGIHTKEQFRDELKISTHEAKRAVALATHPEAVKKVIDQSRKEKELPTRERIHRAIQDEREKASKEVAKREIRQLTSGQEIRIVTALQKMVLAVKKLPYFSELSPRARMESMKLAEVVCDELDARMNTRNVQEE